MVSVILTQPSSIKQFGSNLANEKGHWKRKGGSYLYIHLYYRSVTLISLMFDLITSTTDVKQPQKKHEKYLIMLIFENETIKNFIGNNLT